MRSSALLSKDESKHSKPGLHQYNGLVDSPFASAEGSLSGDSSFNSSVPYYAAPTPAGATVNAAATGRGAGSIASSGATPPTSPIKPTLKAVSSFKGNSTSKRETAETVKFVDQSQGSGGASQRVGRAGPARVVSGMQGTVLPERHGGLPKMGHIAVSYQHGLYVFGGVNGKGQYSNHVFCHEKRSFTWQEIRGVGVVPRGRANHAAVLVDSKIYVFGGHRQLEVFDDLFAFDIITSRWERISYEQSQGPGGVFLHSMIHIPSTETLFVVGGIHHREQNSYVGHLFDIRNRVWSGIPPPPSINPQHLQLVTAVYHEASNGVVVLGLVEDNASKPDCVAAPCVYIFQPLSFAWRRVETPAAPESPLPFRVEAVWEHFLHFLITCGGGLYDAALQTWMFPFPLSPSPGTAAAPDAQGRGGLNPLVPPPPPPNKLGFLVLNLREMSWSLVLCKFPRKLLAEVKTYNAAERLKMERSLNRLNASTASASGGLLHRSSASKRYSRNDSGVLNLSAVSRATGGGSIGGGGGVGAFGQRLQRRNLSNSSSIGVTWGGGDANGDASAGISKSGQRSSGPFGTGSGGGHSSGEDRYRRLINFQDVPEFSRKFVLVAVRDAPLKNGKPRPMQYMVLHGGLAEPTDYTMLAFKPKLTRVDELAATKQNGHLAGFVRTASYRTLRNTRNTTAGDIGFANEVDDDESSYRAFSPLVDTDSFGELIKPTGGAPKKFGDNSGTSFASLEEVDVETLSQAFRNSISDDEIGSHVGGLGDGEPAQHSSLLPTLPHGRNTGNCPRFAMQYAPQNGLPSESLLPYANIPVAVLQTTQEVHKWSKNYYADQRRWLAERLKDALTEDRKLRRFRRIANARGGGQTSSGVGSASRTSRNSVQSDDLSFGDSDSLLESMYLLESMTNLHRGSKTGEKRTSTMQAFEEQLAIEAAVAAVESKEAPKRRVQDFFEERHLEPFVAEDGAHLPYLSHNASATHDTRAKPKKSKRKPDAGAEMARSKTVKSATTPASGKQAGLKANSATAAAAAAVKRIPVKPAPLPSSLAVIMGQSSAAEVGYERFNMRPKRLHDRHHRTSATLFSGANSGHNELARSVAQLLLQNGLDRFRADDDSAETRKRKAQLRWRYVRTLVCTGEASYLSYAASQAQSRMKGVTVASTPGLVLAPELHLLGPSQAYKVPSKPVPYNVSAAAGGGPASTATSSASTCVTHVTNSGMVVYRSLW